LAGLNRRIRIVDVGAQSLGAGTHPYDGLLQVCSPEIIGFDPLQERLQERAETEASPGLTLLPYAVGDGSTQTLYINNFDATSSLFPLNESLNRYFHDLHWLETVRTERVKTRRLDDVLPEGPVDMLKLDVQGAELMVLEGAERILSQTATVHCEVMFSPIYFGQPLFPVIQEHLMSRNFELIDLLVSGRSHYRTPSGRLAQDRLIWADAIFFLKSDDPETQRVQALIAASVYRKPTLAEHLLLQAEQS
jgi:FkbM family methyltransferase